MVRVRSNLGLVREMKCGQELNFTCAGYDVNICMIAVPVRQLGSAGNTSRWNIANSNS